MNSTGLSWEVQFGKKCIVNCGLSNKSRRVNTKALFGAGTLQELKKKPLKKRFMYLHTKLRSC